MSKRRKTASAGSGIDEWIAEHGLDAEIDRLIRTCGYDRVRASLEGAPVRFAKRRERILGFQPGERPGAPVRRDARFYEILFNAVDAVKQRDSLKEDKEACDRFANELAALKKRLQREDNLNLLRLLGLEEIAELGPKTLYREWKRVKPRVRNLADAHPAFVRELKRKGIKAKSEEGQK